VRYRGNWDNYVEEKAAREEQQLAATKISKRNRGAAIVCRSISRQGHQSFPSTEQAETDRPHEKKSAAPVARGKTIKFHFPQPGAQPACA